MSKVSEIAAKLSKLLNMVRSSGVWLFTFFKPCALQADFSAKEHGLLQRSGFVPKLVLLAALLFVACFHESFDLGLNSVINPGFSLDSNPLVFSS